VNYLAWERGYKWQAHQRWAASLGPARMRALIRAGREAELAATAISIESRTNLLFSFEKMALRDALRTTSGAATFASGLYQYLHGRGSVQRRFEAWCHAVAERVRRDLSDLKPRDMIDLQSFIWVQGSAEYP
jgi:hypothetical protein